MIKQDFKKLDELKLKLDSFRPLDLSIVKNLHEDLVLRWTYHSNAIEGNTLTRRETAIVIEKGLTIKFVSKFCRYISIMRMNNIKTIF